MQTALSYSKYIVVQMSQTVQIWAVTFTQGKTPIISLLNQSVVFNYLINECCLQANIATRDLIKKVGKILTECYTLSFSIQNIYTNVGISNSFQPRRITQDTRRNLINQLSTFPIDLLILRNAFYTFYLTVQKH